jgi:hypothetical protein
MKIVVVTIGSRGDVQPYINLCQGLKAAGHDVSLATNPTLGSLAESHGIPFRPVGKLVDMGLEGARLLEKSFDNMWIGMVRVMELGARLVEEAYPDVLEACNEVEATAKAAPVNQHPGHCEMALRRSIRPNPYSSTIPAHSPVCRLPSAFIARISQGLSSCFDSRTSRWPPGDQNGAPPV